MKTRLRELWRWFRYRLPEILLCFFVITLAPLAVFLLMEAAKGIAKVAAGPGVFLRAVEDRPWAAAATALCVLGLAGLTALVWANWGLLWAVARKMIIEALHRKVVIVVLVFLGVLVPSLPFILKTEGSLKSQVQIVLLYSLVLSMVLVSLVAIFVGAASISSEIEQRHVHITDTKPLRRWQFLLGKWLGVVVLCTAVIYVLGGLIILLVGHLTRQPDYRRMKQAEALQARQDREHVFAEVLVSRRAVQLEMPDVSAQVEERVKKFREDTRFQPRAIHSYRKAARKEIWLQLLTVPPGGVFTMTFRGLRPAQSGPVQVRFKGTCGNALAIMGRWDAYRRVRRQTEDGKEAYDFVPVASVASLPEGWAVNTFHEITLPPQAVSDDGNLYLAFWNYTVNPQSRVGSSVIFSADNLVEVMQREEGFLPNYYRALLVIQCHVALVAALGLMAGALFSFPVAALVVVCFFIGGLIGPWFAQFAQPDIYANLTPMGEVLDSLWRAFARGLLYLMPDFGSFSPFGSLVSGRTISWGSVATAGAVMVFLKSAAALAVGMFFYARRELARIIV